MEEINNQHLDLTDFAAKIRQVRQQIQTVIVGQNNAIDLLLTAIIADGHVLLEGVPGVAKTLMAKVMAKLIDARFSRLQFTPDLMPSDVLGTTVFNMKNSEFDFHKGPIFADIVLVDETYDLGQFFTVVATQNPVEQEGTYKLPEAQLDRFLMKIVIPYPPMELEVEMLKKHQENERLTKLDNLHPIITKEELLQLRSLMSRVYIEESLLRYIVQVVNLTRTSKAVYLGASPRAAVAMLRAAKSYALMQGRDFVTPDDIKFVAPSVLQHRLLLTADAEMEGFDTMRLVQSLLDQVEVPK